MPFTIAVRLHWYIVYRCDKLKMIYSSIMQNVQLAEPFILYYYSLTTYRPNNLDWDKWWPGKQNKSIKIYHKTIG